MSFGSDFFDTFNNEKILYGFERNTTDLIIGVYPYAVNTILIKHFSILHSFN